MGLLVFSCSIAVTAPSPGFDTEEESGSLLPEKEVKA
jgi:hypothetical protein